MEPKQRLPQYAFLGSQVLDTNGAVHFIPPDEICLFVKNYWRSFGDIEVNNQKCTKNRQYFPRTALKVCSIIKDEPPHLNKHIKKRVFFETDQKYL